jgi:MFS-type transporter involved in bile tolerance (Atg22 family)
LKLDWNIFLQGARAISFAFKAPGVSRPLVGAAFFWYISTLVTLNVAFFVQSSLGGDEALTTAIMGIFAIGAGLGSGLAAFLSKKRSGLGFSTLGISLATVCAVAVYALTPATPTPGVSAGYLIDNARGAALGLSFLLCSIFMGLYVVPLQAAGQRRAPPRERGRIMGAANMMNSAAAVLGSLSVAVVTQNALAPHTAFLLIAALLGAVAAYMTIRRKRVPEGLHDEAFFAAAETIMDNAPASASAASGSISG